jgi:HEAT repeat protein
VSDDAIRGALRRLLSPYGGGDGHARDRDRAAAVLVEAGDDGHAAVRDALAAAPPGVSTTVLVRLLPAFARAEDVPVLAELLRSASDPDRIVAAQALAEHPEAAALTALIDGLSGSEAEAAAAAQALPLRGDRTACEPLRAARSHPDPWVRECAEQAAVALGCG